MEVHCEGCGQKVSDTLGNLLVAGWSQRSEGTLSKRGWTCPSCLSLVMTVPKMPAAEPASPPERVSERRSRGKT
jgi:hypothetical protein